MVGVFIENIIKVFCVVLDFEFGMVGINVISMVFFIVLFGGLKILGIGRENVIDVLCMFMEKKIVFINMVKL